MTKSVLTAFSCLVFGALCAYSQAQPQGIKADPPTPECWPHCTPSILTTMASSQFDPPTPECWPHCTPVTLTMMGGAQADPPTPECWPHCTPAAFVFQTLKTEPIDSPAGI
jgi:hypothetical protein